MRHARGPTASILVLLLAACAAPAEPTPTSAPTAAAPSASEIQLRVFDEIVTAIHDEYIFADRASSDWQARAAEARVAITEGADPADFAATVRDLLAQLEPETTSFLTREERIEAELAQNPVYTGIGAFVAVRAEPDPRIILLSVIEGSPAQQAGLQAHDAIYSIDGDPVRAEEGHAAIERVRGPEGTQVEVLVGSPDGTRRTYRLTRRQVTAVDPVRSGVFAGSIAYLLVPVTADGTLTQAIRAALNPADGAPSGLILDLRVSHSSAEWPIGDLLTLFTDGVVGTFTTRAERSPVEVTGQDVDGSQTLALVLLVGPDTSGTAEILAAALRATGRATVIGLPTAGLVLGQTQRVLADGSLLIFASSSFETAQGEDIGRTGVTLDRRVEADWDQVSLTFDPVLQAAGELVLGPAP